MTRLKASNAEVGIYSAEGWSRLGVGAEVVRDNTITPYAGSWSWCLGGDGVGKNSWQGITTPAGTWTIFRGRVRISAAPASVQTLIQAGAGSTSIMSINLLTSGALQLVTATNLVMDTIRSSAALTPGAWHKLEVAYRSHPTDPNSHWMIAKLDGVEFGRYMFRAGGLVNRILYTVAANTYPIRLNMDEIVINDSTGSADNYWADDTKPLSRSALGYAKPSVRSVGAITRTVAPVVPGNRVVAVPGTVNPGDLLVAGFYTANATDVINPASGWSLAYRLSNALGGTSGWTFFTKSATSSEPSSYSFVQSSGSASDGVSVMYALRGVKLSDPIIDKAAAQANSSVLTILGPSLDVSEGDALILQLGGTTTSTVSLTANYPSVSSGAVNDKNATSGLSIFGGCYGADDGGLIGGEGATFSGNPNTGALVSIAFRAADPVHTKYEMVV